MYKKLIYYPLLVCTILFFASCEEQRPPGLDLGGGNLVNDSSYVASIEQKQEKVILIEELTGVGCSNCPKAAKIIKEMIVAQPNRILAVGLHPPSTDFTEPYNDNKFDFRSPKVDEIVTLLGGLAPLPSAALNREKTSTGGIFDQERGAWISRITPWLSQPTVLNIHLTSTYKLDGNSCEVIAKIALTEDVSEDIFLTIYVIENDIVDLQNDAGTYDLNYVHQHVFRDCITSTSGSSLNYVAKKAGTVLQKRVVFNPMIEGVNGWNLDNCHLIAFVHRSGNDQSILHAQEIHLK